MEAKVNIGEIILYQADNTTRLEVKLENDTVWLTQGQMAELFETTKQNISLHINNAFKEHELDPKVVVKEFLTTTPHGALKGKVQHQRVAIYNLDVIISVGYRVKSIRGTLFRQWANKVLKEYLLRGYATNQRLLSIENQIDFHESKIADLSDKIDLLIKAGKPPKQGIFFQGQIFDAYAFFEKIIQEAQAHIVLIDGYIDLSILERFAQKKAGLKVDIYKCTTVS